MNRKLGFGIFMAIMFDSGARGEGGATESKEQVEARVKALAKEVADRTFAEKSAEIFNSEDSKKTISDLAMSALKSMNLKESDGTEIALPVLLEQMQKQNDQMSVAIKNLQTSGERQQKGAYVDFVQKNIKENTNIAEDRSYQKSMQIKAAALMTTANVTPNVAGGFSPLFGNYIDTEIGSVPKPENVILPLITVKNQPGTENIWYSYRTNEEGDAEFIAEGALKPLADAEWVTAKAAIKEVAVRWKFTKRLMNHAPAVVADFLEHAYELVQSKIDDGVLDGDGLGNNLSGLETAAAAFVVPPQLAGYYERVNIYDVINAMATRIRLSNFRGQITAVLNTVWEAKMMGIKDADGRYITPDFVTPDGRKVGSVNVVFSNKIDDDSILIGDLKRFNLVFAENIEYDEGYENDDFSKNLVSRKLEAFLGTYIKPSDAGSILYDTISSVMDDIAAPEPAA